MNRFLVDSWQILEDRIEIVDVADIKHISKVLRLKLGDKVEISDSREFEYIGEIISIEADKILVRILNKQAFRGEVGRKVTLFQCIPKQSKMETIIQKTVELGVYKIIPVFSARTIVKNKKNSGKTERWNKISAEAVKQYKRGLVPKVELSIKFKQMVEMLNSFDLILFPYENESKITMKDVLKANRDAENIALIIGPEGGFSDEEARAIIENRGKALSLGKTILRTETAGPAALAMIMYELEN